MLYSQRKRACLLRSVQRDLMTYIPFSAVAEVYSRGDSAAFVVCVSE